MHAAARHIAVDGPPPQRPGRARHIAPGDQSRAVAAGRLVAEDTGPADAAIAVVEHGQRGAAVAGVATGDGGQVAAGWQERAAPALAPEVVPGHVVFSLFVC